MFVHWFHTSTCFRSWSKIYTKCCTNNFFTITWQNNFFLAWIFWSCAFDFRICFGKTLVAFSFHEKTYTKCCTRLCNIMCWKTFFACTLRFEFQDMIWKMKECYISKSIKLKIWHKNFNFDFAPLLFTLLTFSCLYCRWKLFWLYRPL